MDKKRLLLMGFLAISTWAISQPSDFPVLSFEKIDDNTTGLTLESSGYFGAGVEVIGDVDGDGVVDLAVGASIADDGGSDRGKLHILFMNSDGTISSTNTIDVNDAVFSSYVVNEQRIGRDIAGLGDLDGDGVPDIAVGAHEYTSTAYSGSQEGRLFILNLNSDGSVKTVHVIEKDVTNGILPGLGHNSSFGSSVTSIGDLDGNGWDELAVGAQQDSVDGDATGAVYILFMDSTYSPNSVVEISEGNGGFTAGLDNNDWFGTHVDTLEDLNGDGIPELVVGAHRDDDFATDAGAIYVLDLSTAGQVEGYTKVTPTQIGYSSSFDAVDLFGHGFSLYDDLDGNGYRDLAIGAIEDDAGASNAGAVWVLSFDASVNVVAAHKLYDGVPNFSGELSASDWFGKNMVAIDFDNDGVSQLFVGAQLTDDGVSNDNTGAVYRFVRSKPLIKISEDTDNLGLALNSYFGAGVRAIGDVDGDGVVDLAVGASKDADGGIERGSVKILFMNEDGSIKNYHTINRFDTNFASYVTNYQRIGRDIAPLGDLDGDGVPDIAVTAHTYSSEIGRVYILLLNNDGSVASVTTIDDGDAGISLNANDNFASSVDSLGDIDGDGYMDILIGGHQYTDGSDDTGAAYIVYLNSSHEASSSVLLVENTNGFNETLEDEDWFGSRVRSYPDLDGNGVPEVLISAFRDDDGVTNGGAVYLVFPNSNGSIQSSKTKKYSASSTELSSYLEANDLFGLGLAVIDDRDGNSLPDIAVGAIYDDDAATDAGAVYFLSIDSTGSLDSVNKLTDYPVYFTGNLDASDRFGTSIESVDISGDGIHELIVGAQFDDDSYTNAGAIYIFFGEDDSPAARYGATATTETSLPELSREIEPGLILYPNPTDGNSFQVQWEGDDQQTATLRIMTMDGKTLLEQPLQWDTRTVDVSTLPEGLYLVNIQGEGIQVTRRFLKQ